MTYYINTGDLFPCSISTKFKFLIQKYLIISLQTMTLRKFLDQSSTEISTKEMSLSIIVNAIKRGNKSKQIK